MTIMAKQNMLQLFFPLFSAHCYHTWQNSVKLAILLQLSGEILATLSFAFRYFSHLDRFSTSEEIRRAVVEFYSEVYFAAPTER